MEIRHLNTEAITLTIPFRIAQNFVHLLYKALQILADHPAIAIRSGSLLDLRCLRRTRHDLDVMPQFPELIDSPSDILRIHTTPNNQDSTHNALQSAY